MRHALCLPPGWRIRQQIFQLVQRKSAVIDPRRWTGRNEVLPLGDVRKRRNFLIPPGQFVELRIRLFDRVIVHPLAFLPGAADAENDHLFVRNRLHFGESIDRLLFELRRQSVPAIVNAIVRDHHDENAAWAKPSRDVLQKEPLHALILPFADFEVVRRIEVQE